MLTTIVQYNNWMGSVDSFDRVLGWMRRFSPCRKWTYAYHDYYLHVAVYSAWSGVTQRESASACKLMETDRGSLGKRSGEGVTNARAQCIEKWVGARTDLSGLPARAINL